MTKHIGIVLRFCSSAAFLIKKKMHQTSGVQISGFFQTLEHLRLWIWGLGMPILY